MWVCEAGKGMDRKDGLAYKLWEAMKPQFPELSVWGYVTRLTMPVEADPDNVFAYHDDVALTPESQKQLAEDDLVPREYLHPPRVFRQTVGPHGFTPMYEPDRLRAHFNATIRNVKEFHKAKAAAAPAPVAHQPSSLSISNDAIQFGYGSAISPTGNVAPASPANTLSQISSQGSAPPPVPPKPLFPPND